MNPLDDQESPRASSGAESDDITDDEWKIIEERALRRDLAADEEVEQVFGGYRRK
jgi:hypothetical protein